MLRDPSSKAAMPEMGAWLTSVGLAALEPVLRAQGIAEDVLPALTDADLLDAGLNVGDRRRLRQAIETWRGQPAAAAPAEAPASGVLRQLTIIFCDLVDATAWCEQLPPDVWHQVVLRYQQAVAEVVQHWGGHIAQYLGDGVLIYFGHPRALEDAAVRAIHAAWAIREAVSALDLSAVVGSALPDGLRLSVRLGVDTGRVMVGDVGAGPHREHLALGDTPHIAARLQSLGEPGSALITEATRRLAAGHFDYDDHGRHQLKGVREARQVWRVRGPRTVRSRFLAHAKEQADTPLLGRGEVLARCDEAWQRARAGQGSLLVLTGEAGMGKSRLVSSWCRQHGVTPMLMQCSALRSHVSFHPAMDALRRELQPDASLMSDASPVVAPDWRRMKDRIGEPMGLTSDQVRALGEMMGWPRLPGQTGALLAHEREQEQADALLALLEAHARRQPALLWIEDVHWADPATLQALKGLLARLPELPILVVCTQRPETAASWPALEQVQALRLEGLRADDAAALVQAVVAASTQAHAWQGDWTQAVVGRTDGVPLFIEELTRAWLDQMARPRDDGAGTVGAWQPGPGLPLTLRDTLAARLDRQPLARQLAQVGAVMGREFALRMLRAVVAMDEPSWVEALQALQDSGLAMAQDDEIWSFKHALVQDAAYDSLTADQRQILHAAVLRHLPAATPADVLARHAAQAGQVAVAVGHWRQAGEQALARLALGEAQAHLRSALQTLQDHPEGTDRDALELPVQAVLGAVLMLAQGWAAPGVAPAFGRARDLALRSEARDGLTWPLWGMTVCDMVRGDMRQARQTGQRLLAVARHGGQRRALLVSDIIQVQLSFYSGEWASLPMWHHHLESHYLDPQDRELIPYYTTDLRLVSRVHALHTAWLRGEVPDLVELLSRLQQLDEEAQSLHHAYSLAWMRSWGAMACLHAGDARSLVRYAASGLSLARSHGFAYVAAMADFQLGWCEARLGEPQAGLQRMQEGLAAFEQTGAGIAQPFFLTVMARTALEAGWTGTSVRPWLDRAQALADAGDECWYAPETARVRALSLMRPSAEPGESSESGRQDPAVAAALDLAEERAVAQGARLWLHDIALLRRRLQPDLSEASAPGSLQP